jgi:hypothetical protein
MKQRHAAIACCSGAGVATHGTGRWRKACGSTPKNPDAYKRRPRERNGDNYLQGFLGLTIDVWGSAEKLVVQTLIECLLSPNRTLPGSGWMSYLPQLRMFTHGIQDFREQLKEVIRASPITWRIRRFDFINLY